MAGHSHSANIRRRKEAGDAKRGKVFSKMARAIMVAARNGGGDPDMNLSLKYAIARAKAVSMPKDNIDRAVKKGAGELDGGQLDTCLYEAVGPGGVFMLIDVLTDNRNRTAPEIRKILERKNAHLGKAAWAFELKGIITVKATDADEDTLMELVLDAGAEDMQSVGECFIVTTSTTDLEKVRAAISENGFEVEDCALNHVPRNAVAVEEATCRKLLELFDQLDDNDDVQNVYSNLDVPDALLAEMP